ncbi:MAG: hypothetical protein IJ511_01165 [Bacteroides sp.]|nr:hypothetical protein [Bacteroides sp.]
MRQDDKTIQVVQLQGTEKKLYALVGPIVMDPKVLKQNYNFPFRTTDKFQWYLAMKGKQVVGFLPVEHRGAQWIINNYYVEKKDADVLRLLIDEALKEEEGKRLFSAVAFIEDREVFKEKGFGEEKVWSRYVKMVRNNG